MKLTQVDYKTHQLYNKFIAKLLGLNFKIYVVAYYCLNSCKIKYKVFISAFAAVFFMRAHNAIVCTKFELGAIKPKSYWGQVELNVLQTIKNYA